MVGVLHMGLAKRENIKKKGWDLAPSQSMSKGESFSEKQPNEGLDFQRAEMCHTSFQKGRIKISLYISILREQHEYLPEAVYLHTTKSEKPSSKKMSIVDLKSSQIWIYQWRRCLLSETSQCQDPWFQLQKLATFLFLTEARAKILGNISFSALMLVHSTVQKSAFKSFPATVLNLWWTKSTTALFMSRSLAYQ